MRARRWWGWPLVPVYAAGLAVKDGLRRVGVLRTRRLGWPVVSVGSLSAGGAGKTPVVIALAELLRGRGWSMDVLSRGYGRSGSGVERVSALDDAAARRFGDEPVLIARRLKTPVWVGADRYEAGAASEDSGPATDVIRGVHVLDDGFQHRGLGRTVDVVLVTAEDLEDALLPAGNRREGLRALRRADVVVVREEELASVEGRVRGWMRADAVIWSVRRELRFSDGWEEGGSQRAQSERESTEDSLAGTISAGTLDGLRVVGFCAIGRPEGFWGMLREAGCEVVERVAFADHYRYGMVDVERLVKVAKGCGAAGFVTTEKDAVKLTAAMRGRLEAVGPVCVAGLDVTFVDEAGVVRDLEGRLG